MYVFLHMYVDNQRQSEVCVDGLTGFCELLSLVCVSVCA